VWEARFGGFTWTSKILPFLPEELPWEVKLDQTTLPQGTAPDKYNYPPVVQEEKTHAPSVPALD
jgi:hypothetical protein